MLHLPSSNSNKKTKMNINICYFCGQEPASELGISVDINII